jgi:hypothetical protein
MGAEIGAGIGAAVVGLVYMGVWYGLIRPLHRRYRAWRGRK